MYAAERARLLLGSYRRGDANDPDTYVAAIAAVLAMYDFDIIREATDPRTGIQSKKEFAAFMPNSGEVKAYCESLISARAHSARYRALPRPESATRREVPPDPPVDFTGKHPTGTLLANFDDALRIYGRPVGVSELGREKPYGSGS